MRESIKRASVAVEHLFAGIPVADRDAAVEWYTRFIGRAPDLIPNRDEAAWQLHDAAWIYVIAHPSRAGSALNTLLVDDLDGLLAERPAQLVYPHVSMGGQAARCDSAYEASAHIVALIVT